MTQLQMPRPWGDNAEVVSYQAMLDQASAGEAAGFDYFWLTEMHFFEEIGHSPCPVMLVTINHPFYIAERVATLDVLSNGRVEFGMGRGSTPYMVEAFGVTPNTSRSIASEAVQCVIKMWGHDEFPGHQGRH